MATNERIRQRFQAGFEPTLGAGAVATRIVYADITPSYDRPPQDFPDRSGTYEARRRFAQGRPNIGFSGTDMLTFEDINFWFELGVKGNVTPSADAGTPIAYTRVYNPHPTNDDLQSINLEFNESGNPYESSQFRLNSWTIRIDPDNEAAWMFDFEALARDWEPTTFTAALPERSTEAIRAAGTLAYLDTATIGTTQLVAKVISASITCNLNVHMKAFMENELDWAEGKVGREARTFDATIVVEFDNDDEFANYRASVAPERKLRLIRTGSTIHDAIKKSAAIDLYGYWSSIGFGDRQGNLTATFGLRGYYNPTDAVTAKFTTISKEATIV